MNLKENIQTREDYTVSNVLADGVLVRTVSIPKGHLVVGEVHKHSNISFLIKGKVQVHYNGTIEYLEAPQMIVSIANTRKVVHALEDVVWSSVHATTKTNLIEIEKEIIVEVSKEDLIEELNNIKNKGLICHG